ncbi:MAG: SAM-dependent methyltransferase, partial [Planctomycetota bacterium]
MSHEYGDLLDYNRKAWNKQVQQKNQWTLPVTSEQIADARIGKWQVVLTPTKPVPAHWFPDFQ